MCRYVERRPKARPVWSVPSGGAVVSEDDQSPVANTVVADDRLVIREDVPDAWGPIPAHQHSFLSITPSEPVGQDSLQLWQAAMLTDTFIGDVGQPTTPSMGEALSPLALLAIL